MKLSSSAEARDTLTSVSIFTETKVKDRNKLKTENVSTTFG